jgi:mannonate dehydratase
MPNALHDHIKAGDALRDECVEKALKMFPIMADLGIDTLCFNFMAHVGWTRTSSALPDRGDALVTGFDLKDYTPKTDSRITSDELWSNYEYFIKAAVPVAERYGIKLALHPDDPPLPSLGGVERIMISYENIKRAINTVKSPSLGVTMCQATYLMMGEDVYKVIEELGERIFFVHFRNARGNKYSFRETFDDDGMIDMANIMAHYKKCGVDVPIRVDHVPLMAGEDNTVPGYTALGRLFAIGYLKGILDAT